MTIWHWLALLLVAALVWGAARTSKKAIDLTAAQRSPTKAISLPGTGVGGWLALLIVGLVLVGPLRSVQQLSDSLTALETATPKLVAHPVWNSYKSWAWAVVLSAAALSIFTGARLAISREASVVKYSIASSWLCGPVVAAALGIAVPLLIFGDHLRLTDVLGDMEMIGGLLVLFSSRLSGRFILQSPRECMAPTCSIPGSERSGIP